MLAAMFRLGAIASFASFVVFGSACACNKDKGASNPPPVKEAPPAAEQVPAAGGGQSESAPDPERMLHAEEGTLTVDKCEGKAGSEVAIAVKVVPAAKFHLSKNFPIKLKAQPPDGVKLAKAELVAGGRDEKQGDADAFTEKVLAFSVRATPDKPGNYEIKGSFKFGVCDDSTCHPKLQPLAIQCAAL
jgi:hypothetical protein